MSEHTKGPWIQDGLRVRSANGYICVVLRPQDGGTFDAMDNAAAIATLPDLLEALEQTADCLEDMMTEKGGWAWEEVLEQARAAVARARERSE